jgi:N-carbamoylputrescine amidase
MWLELAESATDGPSVGRMREVAKEHAIAIVAPIFELAPTGQRFNTAVVIEKNGDLLGSYRKTHIPEGRNEENQFCETYYYERSDGRMRNGPSNISDNPFFPVFETSACRLGVAICYDRHFPGVMRSLAKAGAELVLSPAVTFGEKSERMWQREFEVDACRENLFIGGSNRRGAEPPWNQPYFGKSYFVGPNGRAPPIPVHPDLIVADLDLESLSRPDPSGWALARDRRDAICD